MSDGKKEIAAHKRLRNTQHSAMLGHRLARGRDMIADILDIRQPNFELHKSKIELKTLVRRLNIKVHKSKIRLKTQQRGLYLQIAESRGYLHIAEPGESLIQNTTTQINV